MEKIKVEERENVKKVDEIYSGVFRIFLLLEGWYLSKDLE